MKKKALSLLLALTMCLSLLPTAALAEEMRGTAPPASEGQDVPAGEQGGAPAPEETDGAVESVQTRIDALPGADELDGMDADARKAAYMAVQDAYDAYEKLTEAQQAEITGADRFEALFGWFNEQVAPLADATVVPDNVDANGNIIPYTDFSQTGPKLTAEMAEQPLSNQFYIVEKDMTINGNLTVDGSGPKNGGLVLCAGVTLTVNGALIHTGGSPFYIYGQTLTESGKGTGKLVINNSNGDGAAIRTTSTSTSKPQLNINSGELEIYAGKSDKLVDGVKLFSSKPIHKGTLDGNEVLPEKWSASSIPGTSLVLAYCDHDHATYERVNDNQHKKHCADCGFIGTAVACGTNGTVGYVSDGAKGHYQKCPCGNKFGDLLQHDGNGYLLTNNDQEHILGCGTCGYTSGEAEAHKDWDEYGACGVCGFEPILEGKTGNLYDDLAIALDEGETALTLVSKATGDANKGIVRTNLEFDTGADITLDMGGCTLENSQGGATITVASGTLTVKGDATIEQTGSGESASSAISVTGGALDMQGKVTLTGGLKLSGSGTLVTKLKEGDVLNGGVSVASGTVADLLGENLAFAKVGETSTIVKGDVTSISENVTVVAHTHDFKPGVDGKYTCACGYTCPHNSFVDGKCTVCHKGCAHTDVGADGVCRNCKTQMAVKSETGGTVTYGTDFKAAMKAAVNGTTVTLLADIEWGITSKDRAAITGDGKIVTLDLNGHTITGGWLDIGSNESPTSCTLKIIGKGSHESLGGIGGYSSVSPKATLDLSKWEGGTISTINISDSSNYEAATREAAVIVGPNAGTIGKLSFGNNQLPKITKTKLSGGSFNEIEVADFGPVKLGELLADGYAFQNGDGAYVKYETTLRGASISNVKVVKCLHPNMKPGEDGVATCEYCGKSGKFVASVDGNLYTADQWKDAFKAWLGDAEDEKANGILKLYTDYKAEAADATWSVGYRPNGNTLDLNGHMMSVKGDGAFFKPTNNMHLTVTDGTELGQITNILLDGSQGGSFTLENGFVGNLKMTGGAVVALKGGSVDNLDVKNCSASTNLSIQGGSLGKLNIEDWADGMHVSATGGSLGAYTLPSGKILADVLDHQYYAEGTSLDRRVDTARPVEKFVIKKAPYDFGSPSKAANVPINGSIPFMVDSPSENVGVYDVRWYRRTNSDAEHMMENRVAGVKVGDKLDVFCVITGLDQPNNGTVLWQVAVKGYTINVVPAKLSGDTTEIVITNEDTLVYDGKKLTAGVKVTYNGKELTQGTDYTVSGNTGTDAGEYTLTIEGMGNYTGAVKKTWEITPLTISAPVSVPTVTKIYDGTTNLPADLTLSGFRSLTNAEISLEKGAGKDYTLSGGYTSANAGSSSVEITITLKAGGNYTFENNDLTATLTPSGTITPATMSTEAKPYDLYVVNNLEREYLIDPAKLLPDLDKNCDFGDTQWYIQPDSMTALKNYYGEGVEAGFTVDANQKSLLYLKVPATADKSDVKKIGAIKVTVTPTNYNEFESTINVNATNKIVPTGAPTLSRDTLAWGEKLSAITLSGTMKDGDTEVKGTFAWTSPETTPDSMSDFAAEWKFTPENTDIYAEITDTVTITVTKTTPKGVPKYTAINVSGKTLKDADLTVGTIQPEGAIQWELGDTTVVAANTAYKWVFTPKDTEHYDELTGSITPYRVSGSGGGSGSSSGGSYAVSAPSVEHGSTAVRPKNAKKGDTVTITVTPDAGYALASLTVMDRKGSALTLTDKGDGTYTFTMPAGKVEVKAAFTEEKPAETSPFGDVSADAYYYEAVKWAVENGITSGTGKGGFAPDAACTRAQIVTFLWRAAGSPEPKGVSGLSDVPVDSWYAKAAAWAVENGITSGTGKGRFAPDAPCTRAQCMALLFRASGASVSGKSAFTDVAEDAYYAGAVAWAVENGITSGTGKGRFSPDAPCTRAQIVTFLWRARAGK
ncbi:S-layer homology domain-containing protein [Pseudoflavonifractor sp. MSJ-37]|uniref:S-layer homology domain-containing protein n=1 Tax=Pseudoflavonifractor sp. MSJ-37 TaxID=2841531 RepID=UPI001C10A98C|nr:S-layer homology domain-containing protein [Pseudoflavonifractor sp. MSJ-37]MBU5434460.1 S-layer homology domain-containing protein [Pseudoflavonifractor sp. MSJ-37]